MLTFKPINFGYQKQLRKALERGDQKRVSELIGKHNARSHSDENGEFLSHDSWKVQNGKDVTSKVMRNWRGKAFVKDMDNMHEYLDSEKHKRRENKAVDKVLEQRRKRAQANAQAQPAPTQPNIPAPSSGSTKKSRLGYLLKGSNTGTKADYRKNMALRAGEGAVAGTVVGGVLGNLEGRAWRNVKGWEARDAASAGLKNKFLNAINRNRLNNIEKEARSKESLLKHTVRGAVSGAGVGAVTGLGAGALETKIRHMRRRP